jgi:hypothetical protein
MEEACLVAIVAVRGTEIDANEEAEERGRGVEVVEEGAVRPVSGEEEEGEEEEEEKTETRDTARGSTRRS